MKPRTVYAVRFVGGEYTDSDDDVWKTNVSSLRSQRIAPGCAVVEEVKMIGESVLAHQDMPHSAFYDDTNTYETPEEAVRSAYYEAVAQVHNLEALLKRAKLRRSATLGWFEDNEDK